MLSEVWILEGHQHLSATEVYVIFLDSLGGPLCQVICITMFYYLKRQVTSCYGVLWDVHC